MHVLIIEDDARIARNIKKMLESSDILATVAPDAEKGIYYSKSETYDVVILDWMLPDKEGIEVCRLIRSHNNTTPIIMLTAKSQLEDKIEGLSTGADDYLTKPFAMEELLARVNALIRRGGRESASPLIQIADLTINTNTREAERGGREIVLAPREYTLLEYMARNKGLAIERIALLHHVWGEDVDLFSNTVDVHIRYLRKKIDDGFSKKLIRTIKNKGYMLCED